MHAYVCCFREKKTTLIIFMCKYVVEGQSDGSGEEDISTVGSGNDRGSSGLRRFTDQRAPSDGSMQQEMDNYPSTTAATLWSNSSRY